MEVVEDGRTRDFVIKASENRFEFGMGGRGRGWMGTIEERKEQRNIRHVCRAASELLRS